MVTPFSSSITGLSWLFVCQTTFPQVALKLGSSQEMKRSRLLAEANQARKGEDEEVEEEEERAGDAEEEDEEEGGAHDTITSLAGAKMLQKYNKKLQYRGSRLAGSKPGSIHQLESLFKEEDKIPEEDEKPFLADAEVEEEDNEEEEDVFVPPDGGYGWFVTLGAFISLFWTSGLVGCHHFNLTPVSLFNFPAVTGMNETFAPLCTPSYQCYNEEIFGKG